MKPYTSELEPALREVLKGHNLKLKDMLSLAAKFARWSGQLQEYVFMQTTFAKLELKKTKTVNN